jgi:tetratricopeptide (TPR) repeat protein
MGQGRVEEAIKLQEKVLEITPGDALNLANLALYLQKDMQVDRSAELFARAIRMDRKAPAWFWENYGEALVIAGKYDEAIPIYHKALESGVEGVIAGETHLGLAVCYDAVGRDGEARAAIKAAIEAAPDLSVSFLRDFQTYTDQAYKERWLVTLKRLGLPEG